MTTWPTPARWTLRLAPLVLVPAALVFLFEPRDAVTPRVWALSLLGCALVLLGHRAPLAVSLAQSSLLLAALLLSPASLAVVQLLAAFALGELAMRRPWFPQLAAGCAAATGVGACYLLSQPEVEPVPTALRLLIVVGVPVLAGRHLRSTRELTRYYRGRGLDAERLRDAEVRAAREAERTSIARELHDLVAHHVSSIVLRVGVARHVAPDAATLRAALDDVHTTGSDALKDLRDLVAVLRAPSASDAAVLSPDGLGPAIRQAAERCGRAGFGVTCSITELGGDLDSVRRLAVLRIVQESLTNVMRHARPGANVEVEVRGTADHVEITVLNDGVPRQRPGGASGHGLIGMSERVTVFGGTFRAGPTPAGWHVTARFPRTNPADLR
ncbi:sensor histidine kinase [Umezawaea tangerina]|uniref:histidine kinase n=1 Tax=Umezawaea tangerina TaxID=84725 RepID=A0A2T0TFU4_9PSEU|nr:histidine kinase [Umezawaea tangerina]PRY44525.1 signal transduction histidine kinase [Umezawaea tangerina]